MTESLAGKRIAYFGDWVFYIGPQFIESPFEMMAKDCHLQFLGKPVTDALSAAGAEVNAYSNWDLYHLSPADYERILNASDLVVVSDVEARCFHLNPAFFDRSSYGKQIITFPDRLKQLARRVESGMGLLYMGGWLSFSGHMDKGGWRRSPIADWLPFECLNGEDIVEGSEGFKIDAIEHDHPMLHELDTPSIPPILGYNEIQARGDFHTLWKVRGTEHPLLGVAERGRGRMAIYASDPVPHWGINLMLWPGYARLWQNAAAWATHVV